MRAAPFLLLLLAPAAAGAQEVPARLTLEDAIRVARARNPAYRRAQNDIDIAALRERRAYGAFLPSLDANVRFGGSTSRTVTGEDDFGQPRRLPDPLEFTSSSASQGLNLSYTLFDGFSNVNALRAARASTRAAAAGVEAEAIRVDAEVSRRFFAAMRAERLILLEERLLASARERLDANEQMLRVAKTHPEDLLGAQVDLARSELALERARGEARKAALRLREIMGVEDDIAFELSGELPSVTDPALLDAESLVRRALGTAPRVRALVENLAAAERRAGAAGSSRWPVISVNAAFTRFMSLRSSEALFEMNPQNRQVSFGIGASLPLFTRFQTSMQIAEADAAAEDARESLREGRLALEQEVRSALIDLANASRALELAERAAELSRERVELAQEKYRLGAVSFTEIQTLTDQAAQAEREAISARFDYVTAFVTLEERVGGPLRD